MHDPVSGIIATARKEELLVEIERQRELGDAGLLEEDKYLAEVNLEELSTSSGEFDAAVREWENRPAGQKTWQNIKTFISAEHAKENKQNKLTAKNFKANTMIEDPH